MATFQDARDGLDALLEDEAGKLQPDKKDRIIKDAARTFQRESPRVIALAVTGDGGFEYPVADITGFVDGFSTILDLYFPWDEDNQDPVPLEPKEYTLFDHPDGTTLRFRGSRPQTSDEFLIVFSAPHTATPDDVETTGTLSADGTIVDGTATSTPILTNDARDARIYAKVTDASGASFVITVQMSDNQEDWYPAGRFNVISATGNFILPLEKKKVSKYMRLSYETTGGAFTFGTKIEWESDTGSLTIKDHDLDAFAMLCASFAARALGGFYAGLVDSQLSGDTADFESKSAFWDNLADKWIEEWKGKLPKLTKNRKVRKFGQGSWDLKGTGGWSYLTHDERHR